MGLAVVTTEPQAVPTFEDFWLLYPRKVKRKDTLRIWGRLTDSQKLAAMVALVPWRAYWLKKEELEYVPHPSTWLFGERWHDELPADAMRAHAHASHVPFVAKQEDYDKPVMPPGVRDLIAKLKGQR